MYTIKEDESESSPNEDSWCHIDNISIEENRSLSSKKNSSSNVAIQTNSTEKHDFKEKYRSCFKCSIESLKNTVQLAYNSRKSIVLRVIDNLNRRSVQRWGISVLLFIAIAFIGIAYVNVAFSQKTLIKSPLIVDLENNFGRDKVLPKLDTRRVKEFFPSFANNSNNVGLNKKNKCKAVSLETKEKKTVKLLQENISGFSVYQLSWNFLSKISLNYWIVFKQYLSKFSCYGLIYTIITGINLICALINFRPKKEHIILYSNNIDQKKCSLNKSHRSKQKIFKNSYVDEVDTLEEPQDNTFHQKFIDDSFSETMSNPKIMHLIQRQQKLKINKTFSSQIINNHQEVLQNNIYKERTY